MIATMRSFEQLETSIYRVGWLKGPGKLLKEKGFLLQWTAT